MTNFECFSPQMTIERVLATTSSRVFQN